MQSNKCVMCERVALSLAGNNPRLIYEFEHSVFLVGDHQFHKGYCLLIHKAHVREPHELSPDIQMAHFMDLMCAARAIHATFDPWKLNYSCFGNEVPHIHWHIFPRYADDPARTKNPWAFSSDFDNHCIDERTAQELAEKIGANLMLITTGNL